MTSKRILTFLYLILTVAVRPALPAAAQSQQTRTAIAADRVEISELGARFDNALDAENKQRFVATFVPDGVLAGFWGEAKGPDQIGQAFDSMLATFARNRRHVVTNHEITVSGKTATMYSYLTVFDRSNNSIIGTATFTDDLVFDGGQWRFRRRQLKADKNVDTLIQSLPK